ncbi:TnpA family transposase [Kribbella orskensis]|uniref:TnpA family transposase n=1 Tax=Kribbella orskensis TaxID=2512216 RepID=A0ABY2B6R6_9ACTN|nr:MULTISPECIES: Tn3 family transposase [Kribbella]TCN29270.1 TnpA family transposase [Kribbella sp. VKM Ac-2500]TCO09545.1 TnpA family transposase [Kribbella orskensis]
MIGCHGDAGGRADELVEFWTLLDEDRVLLAGKRGATALGCALLLKYYSRHSRFPRSGADLPEQVIGFVARQVGVEAAALASYEWSGRTVEYHRAEIREHLGFRLAWVADQERLTSWLATSVARAERRADSVREELLTQFRRERVEAPTPGRVLRMARSALRTAEQTWTARITERLHEPTRSRLLALIAVAPDESDDASEDGESAASSTVLGMIKSEPGNISLESMMAEIGKLEAVRAIALPPDLFADVAPRVMQGWRARAAVEAPSHLRRHPEPLTVTLLAALLHRRELEITDTLVELLIATVHRIGARAERRVTNELINAFKKVTGKENILFQVADAALQRPDDAVRDVVFPAVAGGEATLRELVQEFKTKGPVYRRTLQTTLRASYTGHYRRGLVALLEVLEFRSNNTAHRPVIEALALIRRYATAGNLTYYPLGEHVPTHRATTGDWSSLIYRTDTRGRDRVHSDGVRGRDLPGAARAVRCKEIWIVGADSWRNPEQDLPADFDQHRAENYRELRKPLDPTVFIDELRTEMAAALEQLDSSLPTMDWLEVTGRAAGPITLSKHEAAPEPVSLRRVKAEVGRRWGTVALIDVLKETVLRTGCLNQVSAVAGGGALPVEVLAERLMLAIYAYGTNTGIRAVAAGRGHQHSEEQLRYARRRYLTREAAQQVAVEIANATFAARQQSLWGAGSTAVASDSTHFRSWDQNIFTDWHSRYGGCGILIYWHVERGSMVVHSQRLRASASEVHAMVEGAIRHGTSMSVEGNYVGSHGHEIGFGITRLLGFDLLPRIKQINKVRLYRPAAGQPAAGSGIDPAHPVGPDRPAVRPDDQVRHRDPHRHRLHRSDPAPLHPLRVPPDLPGDARGRPRATDPVRGPIPARPRAATRDHRGPERGRGVQPGQRGPVLRQGRRDRFHRADDQEMSVACLRILQAALVYINTLLLQDVLGGEQWANLLTDHDRRGLTPLFWQHILPYGEVKLDMTTRLDIRADPPIGRP